MQHGSWWTFESFNHFWFIFVSASAMMHWVGCHLRHWVIWLRSLRVCVDSCLASNSFMSRDIWRHLSTLATWRKPFSSLPFRLLCFTTIFFWQKINTCDSFLFRFEQQVFSISCIVLGRVVVLKYLWFYQPSSDNNSLLIWCSWLAERTFSVKKLIKSLQSLLLRLFLQHGMSWETLPVEWKLNVMLMLQFLFILVLHVAYTVVYKNVPLLFFEQFREILADFHRFWRATSGRNLTQVTLVLATSL